MNQLTPLTKAIGLTDAEIQTFSDEGYLVIDAVFPPEDVEALKAACESPEVVNEWKKRDYSNRTVHLLEITVKHPIFMELAKSQRILKRITPLIGADIQLQHSKLATKPPAKGKGPVAWHQDFAFFPHTNTDLVAVMVMLDDAICENGCMQVVVGSHKLGVLNHIEEGLFNGRCQESYLWEDTRRIAHVTPKAGGISIHHCLTLHGSPAKSVCAAHYRPDREKTAATRADVS